MIYVSLETNIGTVTLDGNINKWRLVFFVFSFVGYGQLAKKLSQFLKCRLKTEKNGYFIKTALNLFTLLWWTTMPNFLSKLSKPWRKVLKQNMPPRWNGSIFFYTRYSTYCFDTSLLLFRSLDQPWSQASSLYPGINIYRFFITQGVQHSHCSSTLVEFWYSRSRAFRNEKKLIKVRGNILVVGNPPGFELRLPCASSVRG